MYFPIEPKIQDGLLLYPVTSSGRPVGKSERVFSSLNFHPLIWHYNESVYRQIETHWFIKLRNY